MGNWYAWVIAGLLKEIECKIRFEITIEIAVEIKTSIPDVSEDKQ